MDEKDRELQELRRQVEKMAKVPECGGAGMMPLPRNGQVIITIKDAYVTDWEPVIRCKDCKYFKQIWGNRQPSVCRRVDPLNPMPTKYMGFCSFGEAEHEHTN